MIRQAFHYVCGYLAAEAACLDIPPVPWSKCRNTLLVSGLLIQAAVCSPMIVAQPKALEPQARMFSGQSADAMPPSPWQWISSGPPFFPLNSASALSLPESVLPSGSAVIKDLSLPSMTESKGRLESPSPQTSLERYPYLLLTIGLILLAFRPANSNLVGRH